jgi:hypothetical protein
MHGRRALSEQDCWSDIGGVVLRERQCHERERRYDDPH